MYAARAVGTEVVKEVVRERGSERKREGVKERGGERERVSQREWYEEVRRRDMMRKIQGIILEIERIYSDRIKDLKYFTLFIFVFLSSDFFFVFLSYLDRI